MNALISLGISSNSYNLIESFSCCFFGFGFENRFEINVILLKNFNDLIIKERQLECYKEEYEKFDISLYEQKISFTLKFLIPIQNTMIQ